MIDRLALPLLLVGCVLLAAIVVAELEPSSAPARVAATASPPPAPESAPLPRSEFGARFEAQVTTVLARPLFSSTRRPPPRGSGDASDDSGLADTRLAGIVIEPGRRIAIFAPAGTKPVSVNEGQTMGRWRVESITPREVSLSGPDGIRTLQPKPDPNLVAASGPPPVVNRPAAAGGLPFSAYAPGPRPGVLPPIFNRAPPRPGQLRGRR
jgi:hypothetical protein